MDTLAELANNQGIVIAVLCLLIWFIGKFVYPDFIKRPYDEAMTAQKKSAEDADTRAKESEARARDAQDQVLQLMGQFQKSQQIQNETMQRLADEMATVISVTTHTQNMIDECMEEKDRKSG